MRAIGVLPFLVILTSSTTFEDYVDGLDAETTTSIIRHGPGLGLADMSGKLCVLVSQLAFFSGGSIQYPCLAISMFVYGESQSSAYCCVSNFKFSSMVWYCVDFGA